MYILFFICVIGIIVSVPFLVLSYEHVRLWEKYGKEKGAKIGEIYGRISGDLMFISLIGIFLSPQPRFIVPIFQNLFILVPIINFSIPLIHLIISIPFVWLGVWLLINAVRSLSRKVSETHRVEKIVTTGIYSTVRHPQHLGWFLVQVGFTFLLSGWYALLASPLILGLLYLLSRKEEAELIKEFGKEYVAYKRRVPMFIPGFGKIGLL